MTHIMRFDGSTLESTISLVFVQNNFYQEINCTMAYWVSVVELSMFVAMSDLFIPDTCIVIPSLQL
jgi:hypothetical protein